MANFGPLAAEIDPVVWGTPANLKAFRVLACSATARHSSSGRRPNFAALNRGRHLYSAGQPSHWAFAHIPSFVLFMLFSPCLMSAAADWMSTILLESSSTHGVVLVRIWNAGLKCAPRGSLEMQDPKKSPKFRYLGTIAQLCWAISSQRRHVSTIEKTC